MGGGSLGVPRSDGKCCHGCHGCHAVVGPFFIWELGLHLARNFVEERK